MRTIAIDLLPRFQTTSMSAEAMNLNTTVKKTGMPLDGIFFAVCTRSVTIDWDQALSFALNSN